MAPTTPRRIDLSSHHVSWSPRASTRGRGNSVGWSWHAPEDECAYGPLDSGVGVDTQEEVSDNWRNSGDGAGLHPPHEQIRMLLLSERRDGMAAALTAFSHTAHQAGRMLMSVLRSGAARMHGGRRDKRRTQEAYCSHDPAMYQPSPSSSRINTFLAPTTQRLCST